jgi:aerobic carbon-monoxide dehydrogenase small subunit
MSDSLKIGLSVNGSSHVVNVTPRRLLSDVLREDLGLTGTHVGCEHGVCGACTILIDGRPARACITFAIQMERHEVTTIEAVACNDVYSPLQQAMHEEHGLQCGFCTPGVIMTFEAYLRDNPDPSETEIRDVLSGNICRCTGYQGIVAAVVKAAADIRKRQP